MASTRSTAGGPDHSASRSVSDGELILDRFRIVRYVGGGGMGEVYEAIDLEMGRIALKTIRPDIANNPDMLARFKKEVALALKISGPHVCRIHAFFPKAFNSPPAFNSLTDSARGAKRAFLTMEFLEGITLADKIRESGPLPWPEAKAIVLEICEGLQTIHDAGVIHRDLKPRNIMLASRNGSTCAVVMDFGLARQFFGPTSETLTNVSSSSTGEIAGTPAYMAPEQFDGKEVSPATDVYALGVILYELVTGKHAFEANTPMGAAIHRAKHPAPAHSVQRAVPRLCDRIIERCLEYEPEQRFQSAIDVAKALQTGPANLTNIRKDRPWILQLACALVLAVMAWGGFQAWQLWRYDKLNPTALKWYAGGVAALREGSYVKATRLLSTAIDHDKHFAMTHARLAEAWANLDFDGNAKQEMLIASTGEHHLRPLDVLYLNAISATITEDFPGAQEHYRQILHDLPDDQKTYGYLDLARASEKAGDMNEAVTNYEAAAKIDPEDPAPFVHLGILKSRQMDNDGGEAAFKKADSLYEAESNLEGRAEVAYQRGYAANVSADSARARSYLETSLQIARQIPNTQLEVRTVGQMSGDEVDDGHYDQAIEYAKQEIQLAEENGIEYWSTDGLNRLGTAYFSKEDFADAERSFQQALRLCRKNQHPKLEANADFGLASIRDQQGKWDESIPLAQAALQYYKTFTYISLAAEASELIIRGEEGKGDTTQALQSANDALKSARTWNDPPSIEIAEESVGRILLGLERFPDALPHYEEALKASRLINMNVAYQELHCADALWRLGRYGEAEEMLASIPKEAAARSDVGSSSETIRAEMLLSERHFGQALSLSQSTLARFPDIPAHQIAELERVETLAESELGQTKQAQKDAQQLLALAQKQSNEALIAKANMVLAVVDLRSNLPDQALPMAQAANQYFSKKSEAESEWLSLYYAAKACKVSGDVTNSSIDAKKALDILGELEQTWSPPTYQQYSTRPDHQIIIQELVKLRST